MIYEPPPQITDFGYIWRKWIYGFWASHDTQLVDLRYVPIVTKTASYTLTIVDDYILLRMNSGSANTVTFPAFADVPLPIGTQLIIKQMGAGATTLVGDGAATLNGYDTLVLAGQKALVAAIKEDTDDWAVGGRFV